MLFHEPDDLTVERDVRELGTFLRRLACPTTCEDEVTAQVTERFTRTCAVLVLDMCWLSRTTRSHGPAVALAMIHDIQALVTVVVDELGGRVVNTVADSICCVFDTTREAVAAARAIHRDVATANPGRPPHLRLGVSIGIGFGDVLVVGSDKVFGDEVNVAGKLGEDVAGPGEVLLSAAAWADIEGCLEQDPCREERSDVPLEHHHLALV